MKAVNLLLSLTTLSLTLACGSQELKKREGPSTTQEEASFISGGDLAKTDSPEAKSTVAIDIGDSGRCTGTIISKNRIVTAAHCMIGREPNDLTILFGNNLDVAAKRKRVKKIVIHPDYNHNAPLVDPRGDSKAKGFINDIAFIDIVGRIPSSFKVMPILPNAKEFKSGNYVAIAGYGNTYDGSGASQQLRRTASIVKLVDSDRKVFVIENGNHSTCTGDSGGPAIRKIDGVAYLVGATSWGYAKCGLDNAFTVMTDVRKFWRFLTQK